MQQQNQQQRPQMMMPAMNAAPTPSQQRATMLAMERTQKLEKGILFPKELDEILHLVSPEEVMELLLTVCTQSTEAETIVWAAVEQHPSRRKLFVRSLNYKTSSKTLHEVFSIYGEIEEAAVIFDSHVQRSKGYGFVTFVTSQSAHAALEQPLKEIDGRLTETIVAARGRHLMSVGLLDIGQPPSAHLKDSVPVVMTPAPESGGDGAVAPGGPASGGPPSFPPQNYYNNGGNGQGSQYPPSGQNGNPPYPSQQQHSSYNNHSGYAGGGRGGGQRNYGGGGGYRGSNNNGYGQYGNGQYGGGYGGGGGGYGGNPNEYYQNMGGMRGGYGNPNMQGMMYAPPNEQMMVPEMQQGGGNNMKFNQPQMPPQYPGPQGPQQSFLQHMPPQQSIQQGPPQSYFPAPLSAAGQPLSRHMNVDEQFAFMSMMRQTAALSVNGDSQAHSNPGAENGQGGNETGVRVDDTADPSAL